MTRVVSDRQIDHVASDQYIADRAIFAVDLTEIFFFFLYYFDAEPARNAML